MNTNTEFDAFLSYNKKDLQWADKLKDALEDRGLKIWIDHSEIRPGDMIVEALENGLEQSRSMILLVSPDSINSGWVQEEYSRALALTKAPNRKLRLIPAILRDTKLPGFLENRLYVDFQDITNFDKMVDKLVWGISGREPTLIEKSIEQAIRISAIKLANTRTGRNIALRRNIASATVSIRHHQSFAETWCNSIDILGMTKPKKIDEIYVDLALSDDPRKYRLGASQSSRVTIVDALQESNRLVILGDPGAGKTTTVKKVAKTILQENSEDAYKCIPIIIRLRDFTSKQTLANFLAEIMFISFKKKNQDDSINLLLGHKEECKKTSDVPISYVYEVLSSILAELNVLLLLDGFDELPSGNRDRIITEINELMRGDTRLGAILTSRPADFVRKPEQFMLYEVERLNDLQQNKFIKLWFSSDEERKRTPKEFRQAILDVPYSDFQERPLTLATLCIVFEKYGTLPSLPISIYRKVLNLLLEEWDSERGVLRKSTYGNFDSSRKLDFLAAFSYELVFSKHSGASFSDRELRDIYGKICGKFGLPSNEVSSVTSEIESHTGVIVKSSYDTFEFSHKSIQEYLVGEHISRLRLLPPIWDLINSCPNELAIAVALASDSCEWFCFLFRNKKSRPNKIVQTVNPFLVRLSQEKPTFGTDLELGLATLWLVKHWPNDSLGFNSFLCLEGVKQSILLFLSHCDVRVGRGGKPGDGEIVTVRVTKRISFRFGGVRSLEMPLKSLESLPILKDLIKI